MEVASITSKQFQEFDLDDFKSFLSQKLDLSADLSIENSLNSSSDKPPHSNASEQILIDSPSDGNSSSLSNFDSLSGGNSSSRSNFDSHSGGNSSPSRSNFDSSENSGDLPPKTVSVEEFNEVKTDFRRLQMAFHRLINPPDNQEDQEDIQEQIEAIRRAQEEAIWIPQVDSGMLQGSDLSGLPKPAATKRIEGRMHDSAGRMWVVYPAELHKAALKTGGAELGNLIDAVFGSNLPSQYPFITGHGEEATPNFVKQAVEQLSCKLFSILLEHFTKVFYYFPLRLGGQS